MTIRYRDVPLEEMVALEHSLRVHRHALMGHNRLVTEVVRSKNHKAVQQFRRIEDQLVLVAGEVEGQGLRVYGSEAWNRLERGHLANCPLWAAGTAPWMIPTCTVDLSESF